MRPSANHENFEATLAPGACQSAQSRGRLHPDSEPPYRSAFQRDRDRLIHCGAFRRLEYKTQVFVSILDGDHFRNRLTHTLEVAQIARTIARALGLNEDLVEALALAHDLGHGPFGHAGEDALNEVMREQGGFNHNLQGLRIVDQLERRYPDHAGLNLSYETREGFSKNLRGPARAKAGFADFPRPSLEVQLTGHADEIAYDTHDLEDGLVSGLLDENMLVAVELWRETSAEVVQEHPSLAQDRPLRWKSVVRRLIRKCCSDLIDETTSRCTARGLKSADDARACPEELVGFSPDMQKKKRELEHFLHQHFYRHAAVRGPVELWQERLKQLFAAYQADPRRLPVKWSQRVESEKESLERVICDYVAGMTDRFAERMWTSHCGK